MQPLALRNAPDLDSNEVLHRPDDYVQAANPTVMAVANKKDIRDIRSDLLNTLEYMKRQTLQMQAGGQIQSVVFEQQKSSGYYNFRTVHVEAVDPGHPRCRQGGLGLQTATARAKRPSVARAGQNDAKQTSFSNKKIQQVIEHSSLRSKPHLASTPISGSLGRHPSPRKLPLSLNHAFNDQSGENFGIGYEQSAASFAKA